MNTTHNGFLAKEPFVLFHGYAQDFAVGIHLPPRVSFAYLHMCARQFERGRKGVGHIDACTHDAAALAAVDVYGAVLLVHADRRQIAAGLHQIDVLTDGKHAVVHSLQGRNQSGAGILVHHCGSGILALQQEFHRCLCGAIFFLHVGSKDIPVHAYLLLILDGYGADAGSFTWNGIMQSACLNVGQA